MTPGPPLHPAAVDRQLPHRFQDQVVLVTGGAQGLGRAMVERFAAEGATVRFADLNDRAGSETAAAVGAGTQYDRVDVTDPDQVRRWVDDVVALHERVDVLVNNAGIIRDNRIENISVEDWHAVVDVSLTGAFHCIQAVFGHMKDGGTDAWCRSRR